MNFRTYLDKLKKGEAVLEPVNGSYREFKIVDKPEAEEKPIVDFLHNYDKHTNYSVNLDTYYIDDFKKKLEKLAANGIKIQIDCMDSKITGTRIKIAVDGILKEPEAEETKPKSDVNFKVSLDTSEVDAFIAKMKESKLTCRVEIVEDSE